MKIWPMKALNGGKRVEVELEVEGKGWNSSMMASRQHAWKKLPWSGNRRSLWRPYMCAWRIEAARITAENARSACER
jgi:hypothetical protein